jgi:hypothetical protein
MLSGIQEIIIILFIIILFFSPILRNRNNNRNNNESSINSLYKKKKKRISWKFRLYIVISIIWLCLSIFFINFYEKTYFFYIIVSILPLFLFWGIIWIRLGINK